MELGTLLAVLQVSAKVVTVCHEYILEVKNAPRDISRILDEVTSVRNIIEELIKHSNRADSLSSCVSGLDEPDGPFEKCLAELTNLERIIDPTRNRKSLSSKLVWPLKQKEVEARLAALTTIKSSIQLALTADNVKTLSEIRVDTKSLPVMQKQVSDLSKRAEDDRTDCEIERVAKYFDGREQGQRHQLHLEKRVEGTGDWLFEHSLYKHWIHTTGEILWLRGIAGSGKTVLCANIIDNLRKLRTQRDVALAYIYVDGSEHLPLNANIIYRTLLTQLVSQVRRLPDQLRYLDRYPNELRSRPESYLRAVLGSLNHIYIVVDGLDECEDSMGLQAAFQVLVETLLLAKSRTHLLVTSRTSAHNRMDITEANISELLIAECEANHDLETVLQKRLQHDWQFKSWPQALKTEIEQHLLSKAGNSIHWISCQLDCLKACKTPKAVRTRLYHLPKTVESYYASELLRLQDLQGAAIRNALRWIACSLRPLSVAELTNLISVNIEDRDDPFVDDTLNLLDVEGFLDSCSSLVTTYRTVGRNDDHHNDYVMFTHFTVLEFLMFDITKRQVCRGLALQQDIVHFVLAKSCMAIISYCAAFSHSPDLWIGLEYASCFWLQHKLRSTVESWSTEAAQQYLLSMFDKEQPNFATWIRLSCIDKPWIQRVSRDDDEYSRTSKLTPLYCAALFGLDEVIPHIIKKDGVNSSGGHSVGRFSAPKYTRYWREHSFERPGIYGSPMQAAAAGGHLAAIKALILGGVDVDITGGIFGSAIAAATANGYQQVVYTLLQAKATVQPGIFLNDRRDDPLYLAVKNGDLAICKMLLDYGAEDWYANKAMPCSALHAAVQSGRIDIVKTMLHYKKIRRANQENPPTEEDDWFGIQKPGLYYCQRDAVNMGDKQMFKALVAHGIDRRELLCLTAQFKDEELLADVLREAPQAKQAQGLTEPLSNSRIINGPDPGRKSCSRSEVSTMSNLDLSFALEAAVQCGNLANAKLLIAAGAEIRDASSKPRKPDAMSTAILRKRRDFISLFLDMGVDASPYLLSSAKGGDFATLELLVGSGAHLDHRSSIRPAADITLLQAAAFAGSVQVVQHLLDQHVDIEETTRTHPLSEAIRQQHWPVVDLLLQKGANINALPQANPDYVIPVKSYTIDGIPLPRPAVETPLSLAIKARNESLALELLRRGAQHSPQTPETVGTPLLYALYQDMTETVRVLIDAGADVNKPGTIYERGKTSYPLMLAVEKGEPSMIASLIGAGARVNQQDSEGFSAMHIAAGHSNVEMLKFLVQKYGADQNLCLANGSRPIHSAAARGTVEHVKILLDTGIDVNVRNHAGRTPLHWAAEAEKVELVEMLLERGADANLKADEAQLTPLDMAFIAGEPLLPKHPWQAEKSVDERIAKMRSRLREAMSAST